MGCPMPRDWPVMKRPALAGFKRPLTTAITAIARCDPETAASRWSSRVLPDSPTVGWVTASPPPHPRRWALTPSCFRSARGPPRLPRRQLGSRCGLGRSDLQGTPQPHFGHRRKSKQGRAGGTPAVAGDSKGLAGFAPPLRPQGRIGKRNAPVLPDGAGLPPHLPHNRYRRSSTCGRYGQASRPRPRDARSQNHRWPTVYR